MKKNFSKFTTVATISCLAFALGGCRVETNTESVPEAEGSGKKAINIRVEPMSKDEVKEATNKAIDSSAEFAAKTREAASSAVKNAESIGKAVTTLTDTMININGDDNAEAGTAGTAQVTTTTQVTTETN